MPIAAGLVPAAIALFMHQDPEPIMTAALELNRTMRGTKRSCAACSSRYYDLARDPAVCPMCGNTVSQASLIVPVATATYGSQRGQSWRSAKVAPKHEIVADDEVVVEDKEEAVAEADDDTLLEEEVADESVDDLLTPSEPLTPDE
jgi:uncharacterized protein (TIGR02300 family)